MAKRSVDILIQGRDRASRKFRNVSKASDILSGRLRSLALRASGVAVAFLGFRKVYRVLDSAMTGIDRLAKTSDKLGITTANLIKYHHAAKLSGLETRTFDMALQRMTRRVAEAALGTGEAQAALKELGLDAKALAEGGPAAALEQIAEAMRRVPTQADRVRLAFKLFDSEGVAMVNVLRKGRAGLAAIGKDAEKLGIVLSRVDAAKVEMANDAFARLRALFDGLVKQLAVNLAPFLKTIADRIVDAGTGGETMGEKVTNAFEWIFKAAGRVANIVRDIRVSFKLLQAAAADVMADAMMAVAKLERLGAKGQEKLGLHGGAAQARLWAMQLEEKARTMRTVAKEVTGAATELMKTDPGANIDAWFQGIRSNIDRQAREIAEALKIAPIGAAAGLAGKKAGQAAAPARLAMFESRLLTRVPGMKGRDPNIEVKKNTERIAKLTEKVVKLIERVAKATEAGAEKVIDVVTI